MSKRKLIAGVAVLLTAGMSLTACGPDEPTDKDTGTPEDTQEMDTGVEDTSDTSGEPDTEMDTSSDPDTAGECENENCVTDDYKAEAVTCESDNPPARCDADPAMFEDWGPASALTKLEITSDDAKECCFNINGDAEGTPDNQLATILGIIPGVDVDAQLRSSLASGEFILLNEHEGLSALDQSEDFNINFHLGEFGAMDSSDYLKPKDGCNPEMPDCELVGTSGKKFTINPESFEKGTKPQAVVPNASISDSKIDAGPGKVVINISVPDLGTLGLTVNGATIETEIDEADSNIGDGTGVSLIKGKLGGYVLMKDVIALVNNLMSTCDCLGNPETAVDFPTSGQPDEVDLCVDPDSPDCEVACTMDVQDKAGDCTDDDGAICSNAGTVCGFTDQLGGFADLDFDDDGQGDAVSIGALFEAKGAEITGISEYIAPKDQEVSNPKEVTVPKIFANEAGYMVIHEDDGGSAGAAIGNAAVSAGWNNDLTVTLDREVTDGETLYAMLHTEGSGNSSYDGASDDPSVKDGVGNVVVESFTVTTP